MNALYHGVIFDMDDTLIDSMGYWADVTHDVLAQFGVLADDDTLRRLNAMTLLESISFIADTWKIPKEEFVAHLEERINQIYDKIGLLPGAYEYLKALHEKKIPFALATSNARELAARVLSHNGVLDWFCCLVCADEEGVDKSTPALYLKAAEMMGVSPETCLVFEDLYVGLRSAKQAGFQTISVLSPYSQKERELVLEYSDFAITDYRDLAGSPYAL